MSKMLLSIWTYSFIYCPTLANDFVRQGYTADNNVIPGNHIADAQPNKNKKNMKSKTFFLKIDVCFLVFVLGSYMISW